MTENTQTYGPPGPEGTPEGALPPGPPAPPPIPRPPLRRSRGDRKVAGVCSGLASYLGIDPVILRVLVVVLAVFGGSGLLLYAAGWLLIPEEGTDQSEGQRFIDRNGMGVAVLVAVLVGILLLGLGGGLLANGWWLGGGPDLWPLIVIGAIAAAVWFLARDRDRAGRPPGPPDPAASPLPSSAPTQETVMLSAPPATSPYASSPYASSPYATPADATPPPPRPRSVLGLLTVSVAAITAGVLVAADRTGGWDLDPVVLLAAVTGIVGLGLVVGAFVGRARGLIVLGVLLALVTAGAAAFPVERVSGRTGDIVWAPTTQGQVASSYAWGAGNVTLDLTAVALDGREPVEADLFAGNLVVLLPPTAAAEITAVVGAGTVRIPGAGVSEDGMGRSVETSLNAVGNEPSTGVFVLDLNVGFGELEVRHAAS